MFALFSNRLVPLNFHWNLYLLILKDQLLGDLSFLMIFQQSRNLNWTEKRKWTLERMYDSATELQKRGVCTQASQSVNNSCDAYSALENQIRGVMCKGQGHFHNAHNSWEVDSAGTSNSVMCKRWSTILVSRFCHGTSDEGVLLKGCVQNDNNSPESDSAVEP